LQFSIFVQWLNRFVTKNDIKRSTVEPVQRMKLRFESEDGERERERSIRQQHIAVRAVPWHRASNSGSGGGSIRQQHAEEINNKLLML